jgi:lipopolysaccharide export LptBFGC system permease protein LptF
LHYIIIIEVGLGNIIELAHKYRIKQMELLKQSAEESESNVAARGQKNQAANTTNNVNNINNNVTNNGKRGQRYRAKQQQQQQGSSMETHDSSRSKSKGNSNMLYLGYEYECCAGHRFILSPESTDIMKVLNPTNASMSTSAKVIIFVIFYSI